MSSKDKALLLFVGCTLALVAMVGVVMVFAVSAQRAKPAAQHKDDGEDYKRLFLENHSMDDPARAFIFETLIRKQGKRCDDVVSALKDQARPAWRVNCAPGYRYTFLIGTDGVPTGLLAE